MRKMVYISLLVYVLAVVSIAVSPPWEAQVDSVTGWLRGDKHYYRYDSELYRLPNAPLWNRRLAIYRYYSRREERPPWGEDGPDTSPLRVDIRRLAQQLVMITAMFGGILAIVVPRMCRLDRSKDI